MSDANGVNGDVGPDGAPAAEDRLFEAALQDAGQESPTARRRGRPSNLTRPIVIDAVARARAEHRSQGLRGEPSIASIHRHCLLPGDTRPRGSGDRLRQLLAEITAEEAGVGDNVPPAAASRSPLDAELPPAGLATRIEALDTGLRAVIETFVDTALRMSAAEAAAANRATHLEFEAADLRSRVTLEQEAAALAATDAAEDLRAAVSRAQQNEEAYLQAHNALETATGDRQRLSRLLAIMRRRWFETVGRARQAERDRDTDRAANAAVIEDLSIRTGRAEQIARAAVAQEAASTRLAEEATQGAQEAVRRAQAAEAERETLLEQRRAAEQQAAQLAQRTENLESTLASTRAERDRLLVDRTEDRQARQSTETALHAARDALAAAEQRAAVLAVEVAAVSRGRKIAEDRVAALEAERRGG